MLVPYISCHRPYGRLSALYHAIASVGSQTFPRRVTRAKALPRTEMSDETVGERVVAARNSPLQAIAAIMPSLAFKDGGCEMTAPVERFFGLLIPLWLASGAWGFFMSEPPRAACYNGSESFISRLRQGYSSFSVRSAVQKFVPDKLPDL
jgi:hypothetical protein